MADANFVAVEPQELTFKFELKKSIPVVLMLTNVTGERVAFKVKTTSPKKYCVRPSSGIIEAQGVKEVQVIMQPQKEPPATFGDCKDKFLVQCVKVDAGVKEASSDMFDASKARDIKQTKLRVTMVAPARPPSPVPEGNESEPTSPPTTYRAAATSNAAAAAEAAGRDKAAIQQRLASLDQPGKRPAASYGAAAAKQIVPPSTGFSLFSLLLVAILAFLLGQFTQPGLPLLLERLAAIKEQLMHRLG